MSAAEPAAAGRPLRPRRHPQQLAALLDLVGPAAVIPPTADLSGVAVSGITLDSRLVRPGDLYVALPGTAHHGAEFAADAIRAGATAVLTDPTGQRLLETTDRPVVVSEDPRRVTPWVAARIYGEPSSRLRTFGITGTNGKTTTSYLLESALRAAGLSTGLVGTIGFSLDGEPLAGTRTTVTTPESPDLQALLAVMVERGADAVVMEVSSHALALGRADAIRFDIAGFTNFGRDHLDFHGDLESYFAAKASLFTAERTRRAVINLDDPYGRRLTEQVLRQGVLLDTVSAAAVSAADYRLISTMASASGAVEVRADARDRLVEFSLRLPGAFNVLNAMLALAMADVGGADLDQVAAGLGQARVAGRMQRVDLGSKAPLVVVDFAHTPQAVSAVLAALASYRRIVVLGCGGDRDPHKRGPMGAAAVAGADVVVVTDDNPRSEGPAGIRQQILAGAEGERERSGRDVVLLDGGDRRTAIRLALTEAGPADVVAVLGKGHETGQEISGRIHPFHDVAVVEEEWRRMRAQVVAGESP